MINQQRTEGEFTYLATEGGEQHVLLLHGLFGGLSNFKSFIDTFGTTYNVVLPNIPIFELPLDQVDLDGFVDHVRRFVDYKGYEQMHLVGNSLGGHIALLFALAMPERILSITLTGSSGLFESAMGNTYPKKGDYEYIRERTGTTFYDPTLATKELVDEVFNTVNDRTKAIRILYTAQSASRYNLEDRIQAIQAPVLLIWGTNDTITPPFVAEKFDELLPNSELVWIDKCGHAAMMEHPVAFNRHFAVFMQKQLTAPTA